MLRSENYCSKKIMHMKLSQRIALLVRLGEYMKSAEKEWQAVQEKAFTHNNWFLPEFIRLSVDNIADRFLQPSALEEMARRYAIPEENDLSKKVGIVMAGNIPLVGFHDLLSVFLTGHIAFIKPSSKDEVLIKHLVEKMVHMEPEAASLIIFGDMLKNCDAYIATGSNNSSRYFDYYFAKYPHIIRRNRTSVAILNGKETREELEKLADDVHLYFGLGCRNVSKIYVPEVYDFIPLIEAFRKYNYLADENKYKNNYDYNLAILLLNHKPYMSTDALLLAENESPFSPIAQLHYSFYKDLDVVKNELENNDNIQCVVGEGGIAFGGAQCPALDSFADGVDTIEFLMRLAKQT